MRGAWLNGSTFEIERQTIGTGEQQKWTLSFDGEKLRLLSKEMDGREVAIDGENGG